jgi:elongation factor Ts
MSEISAADVMKLRNITGAQMMACKQALIAAGGDMEKAIEVLRTKFKDIVTKTAGRETAEGRIGVHIDAAKQVGAILELRCESAPVAKNEMFVKLAADLAAQIALHEPATPEALLAQPYFADPKKTVADRISEVVGLMRENIRAARFARMKGLLGEYIHHDGTVGVLLHVEGATTADPQVLRDVCMHIAARNPVAALREHIPAARAAKELEVAKAQAAEQGKGKPANIVEKIAEGKMRTWFAENVLAEQPFVKDDSKTVGALLQSHGLKLVNFVRYKVGEVAAA